MVLLLEAMAAAPALHHLIHKDADKADHQCAVTLFSHGQADTAAVDLPVILPTAAVEIRLLVESSVFGSTIGLLPPGRAPPAVVSPLI